MMIGLVGEPNSGKTTLYNWLTGSNFKTVNYPGATVEYSVGPIHSVLGEGLTFVDTPGVYSLQPKSADENVTLQLLFESEKSVRPEALIVVVDGTQLSRHLLLARQVKETGFPFLLVVTMADLLARENIKLNDNQLKDLTGAEEVLFFDGLLGGGLIEIIRQGSELKVKIAKLKSENADALSPKRPCAWSREKLEKENQHLETFVRHLLPVKEEKKNFENTRRLTQKLDRTLLHPVFGLLGFFSIMALLFSSIYWLAQPFMDWIDQGISAVAEKLIASAPDSLFVDFLGNGLIKSAAAVAVFVPQIFILFFGIGILESTGYLARAATLIDRPLSRLGLSGRSFVPLLSGFACAVPALMATRNISSRRDRLISQLIIPLMTCSARLPVYLLLIGFLYPEESFKAGIALTILYFGALFVGAVAAGILHRMLPPERSGFFMMELPLYRRPRFRVLLKQCLMRTKSYLFRAGPIIFVLAVVLWWGTNFPRAHSDSATSAVASQSKVEAATAAASSPAEEFQGSYASQLGRWIEPIFLPMGVDWRVGFGLLSAFAAREVFVSALAVTFQATSDDEETQQSALLEEMKKAEFPSGEKIFTVSSVVGLLIFFMIALQCMSTFAMMQKESGQWSLAWMQLLIFNAVAYLLAVGAVQGLRWFGVS